MRQKLYEKRSRWLHPMISEQDTMIRTSMETRTRLAMTLIHLVAGSSMADLHYEFNIGA